MLLESVGFLCNSFWPYILIKRDDYLAFFGNFIHIFALAMSFATSLRESVANQRAKNKILS